MFAVLDSTGELVGIYDTDAEAEFVANDIGDCYITLVSEE